MGQPKPPPLSVRLPDGLLEELTVLAVRLDMTRNGAVVAAVREWVDRQKKGRRG